MTLKPKVICFGLGRTGTTSLRTALEILGFGPCYHMTTILEKGDPKDFELWTKIGTGQFEGSSSELVYELLGEYNSALDYPFILYYEAVYQAYPDAKFILTVRDPAKWEASMKKTILKCGDALRENKHRPPILESLLTWHEDELRGRYHKDINYDIQGEFHRHNDRIKNLIPPEKLLIFEVSQGWAPLVNFLGVEAPEEPFPNVNDSSVFENVVLSGMRTFGSGIEAEGNKMAMP